MISERMIQLNAKQYLNQIRKANVMINYKQKQLDELRELTISITANITPDKVQSSGSQDKIGDTIAKIIDLQNDINKDIDRLVDLKREIMNVIDQLDAVYLELIYLRYFEFQTWEQIACEMNYSCPWIWKLHGEALQKVSEILQQDSKVNRS